MARSSEVSLTSHNTPQSNHDMIDNEKSLKVKKKVLDMHAFISNLSGEHKLHVEYILNQLGEALNTIQQKEIFDRENADEISTLSLALEEEEETRAALESKLESLDESHNEVLAKLTKERDHAKAKLKVLKNDKTKFEVGHEKLAKDLENLGKDYKALENENSLLIKTNEQLQTRLK